MIIQVTEALKRLILKWHMCIALLLIGLAYYDSYLNSKDVLQITKLAFFFFFF